MLQFKKYEGLGNDFIIPETVHLSQASHDTPLNLLTESERARWATLCDRRLSIGADGVLIHYQTSDHRHFMSIINQDGSVAEMCGNGLRCMALHIANESNRTIESLEIHTLAGIMRTQVHALGVRCNVGAATVTGMTSVSVNEHRFSGYLVKTGNPHFVLFETLPVLVKQTCAQPLSQHPSFKQGANVSFAHAGAGDIQLNVFERGCGWTQACGTAAIATTAAYWSKHDCEGQDMRVHLPGGMLKIGGTYEVMIMVGPAKFTFSGEVDGTWT